MSYLMLIKSNAKLKVDPANPLARGNVADGAATVRLEAEDGWRALWRWRVRNGRENGPWLLLVWLLLYGCHSMVAAAAAAVWQATGAFGTER